MYSEEGRSQRALECAKMRNGRQGKEFRVCQVKESARFKLNTHKALCAKVTPSDNRLWINLDSFAESYNVSDHIQVVHWSNMFERARGLFGLDC